MARLWQSKTLLLAAVILCGGVLCFVYWNYEWMMWVRSTPHFLLYGFPNDKFEKQARVIQDAANSVLPAAPLSDRALSEHIAVYAVAGEKGLLTQPTDLTVLNVTNGSDQDRVIEAVRRTAQLHHTIPVRINFYQEHPQSPGQAKAGAPTQITRSVIVGNGNRVRAYH